MKKFLSLVLALVMTMSLVTISAGAKDFTDGGKIEYKKAVDVISALDIVDGYTDGAFNPQNTLTRGAAAKIICNLILGPTTAEALSADTAPFKDVPTTNNFAGYITYCAQQGIISGYADGTFRPSNTLTGYAFMKMLLGALGYDAEIEGYVGANWSVQVGKQALGIGLADGNKDFVGTKAVTREEACLYAFNTLEATMVEYDARTSVSVGGADVVIAGSKAKEMEQGSYDSYTNDKEDKTLEFCEKYFSDLSKKSTNDDFGRPADTWKIKSTEIGTYANTSDLVATFTKKVTKKALYEAVGKAAYDDLKDDDADLVYYKDGVETAVKAADVNDFMDKSSTAKINSDKDTGNGALTEVYVDDDNNVTVVTIYTYVFQATADYNSSNKNVKVATAGDTTINLDDYTLDGDDFDIEDIEEDDYLLITATKMDDSSKYEVQTVVKAELVTGEVTELSVGDDVTIDGTTYAYSLNATDDGVKSEVQTTGGQTALVLDAYGYIIAVDDTVVGGNYVFISNADTTTLGTSVIAYAYFADGTEGEITLKKVAGETSKSEMEKAGGWYTYSKDSNDKYTLTAVSGSYKTVKDLEKKDTNQILYNGRAALATVNGTSGIKANEKTIFVIVDKDGDVDVYTGVSNAPDITVKTLGEGKSYKMGYVYKDSNKYATYVFVSVEDLADVDVDASSEDDAFIFLTKLDSTKSNGTDDYYVYKAIVDGVETTVQTDDEYDTMTLYTKIKTSTTTERITGMTKFAVQAASKAKYNAIDLETAEVTYSNGVLGVGDFSFVVNKDSQLNLILDYRQLTGNKDAGIYEMLSDKGNKYEITSSTGSGNTIKTTLSGYAVSGMLYVVTEDDYDATEDEGNTTLDYLFLYVDSTEEAAEPEVTGSAKLVYDESLSGLTLKVDGESVAASLSETVTVSDLSVGTHSYEISGTGAVTCTGSFTVSKNKTTTVELPEFFTVAADEKATFGDAAADGTVKAAAGATIKVVAKTASKALTTANTDIELTETKAPTASSAAEYTFVMPAKAVETSFTEAELFSVSIEGNKKSVQGLSISLDKTYVATGTEVTLTLDGTATGAGTIAVTVTGTSTTTVTPADMTIVNGDGYTQGFTFSVDADTTVTIEFTPA